MRTTLKRGFGRSDATDDGAADSLPQRLVSFYRQPVATSRSLRSWAGRVVVSLALAVFALVAGIGGGLFLWFHQSLISVSNTPGSQALEKSLDAALPGKPVIALVLGDNIRAGFQASAGGRSDTIMLVRADPATKTISLLSLPRDLHIPIYCKNTTSVYAVTRIDYAFAYCGAEGSLNTVKVLTGLKINYLITVDFNGFKKIVNDIGGIWMNVDRSYYNKNVGTAATDYANIDLQPGYQLLPGGAALEFVRFRHTDSDFYRQARQQEFIEALKSQITQHLNVWELPRVVNDLIDNIKVGGCNACLSDETVASYAAFAAELPPGHMIQNYISDTAVQSVVFDNQDELVASPSTIALAVRQFTHPDPGIAALANKAALNLKTKPKAKKPTHRAKPAVQAPPPDRTSITVLNGNGVAGSAANAVYLLTERGYISQLPPDGAAANAPTQNYFDTDIYYDAGDPAAKAAAEELANLLAPANVATLPDSTALHALDPNSMLLVIVGTTFHNVLSTITPTTTTTAPKVPVLHYTQAYVDYEPSVTQPELAPLVHKVDFPLYYPSVLEATSVPDQEPGDVPVRLYTIVKGHKAVVLVFHTAGLAYWDIEETNWTDAPILQGTSFTHTIAGRSYQLYYSGQNLHMIVLHDGATSYWVENTLLNELSNETMIAIAKGLKPMPRH